MQGNLASSFALSLGSCTVAPFMHGPLPFPLPFLRLAPPAEAATGERRKEGRAINKGGGGGEVLCCSSGGKRKRSWPAPVSLLHSYHLSLSLSLGQITMEEGEATFQREKKEMWKRVKASPLYEIERRRRRRINLT